MRNLWFIFGILALNTLFVLKAFGNSKVTLAPGAKATITAGATTEVSCQGSSTAQPCSPVPFTGNKAMYQLKIGDTVHPGVYTTLYDVSYAIKKHRENGLCQ